MTNHTTDEPTLDIAVEEEAAWKRRLTITVAPERVAAARRREQKKLAKTIRIKGFRKGKVPQNVIEQQYGPLIDQRTVNTVIDKAFREAMREKELQPVGDPTVGDVQYGAGEPLTFQVEIEIMPEVKLGRIGGFRVERPTVQVAEAEVEELVERLRGERAVLEPVERAPTVGDVVSVKIAETEEDEPRPYRFELGAGLALPDVEEAILSMEPGASGEFDVRYPDDFEEAELAGQERRLHIELTDVKGKRLPELTDDFASEVGDFDTMDELRGAIREDLAKHHEQEAEQTVHERLIESVIEANPFEVPASLVANYLDRVIDTPDDAEEEKVQAARRTLEPAAERQIKRQLILERLIEEHELVATEDDLEERLRTLAEERGVALADLKRQVAREKRLDALRQQLAVEKAFALLEAESTVQ